MAYGPWNLVQQDGQEIRVLTELEIVGDSRAKSMAALTGGVAWTGIRGVAPGLLILQGGLCGTCDGVQLVRTERNTVAA